MRSLANLHPSHPRNPWLKNQFALNDILPAHKLLLDMTPLRFPEEPEMPETNFLNHESKSISEAALRRLQDREAQKRRTRDL